MFDLQADKQCGHGGADVGSLLHVHAATLVLDYLDGFELVTDVAPGVPGANLGNARWRMSVIPRRIWGSGKSGRRVEDGHQVEYCPIGELHGNDWARHLRETSFG